MTTYSWEPRKLLYGRVYVQERLRKPQFSTEKEEEAKAGELTVSGT